MVPDHHQPHGHQQQTAVRPALFMSSKCPYSSLFLKKLNAHKLIDDVDIVDVLKTPIDVSKVRTVPTLVVDGQRVLVGRDAFAWLVQQIKNAGFECMSSDEMGCSFAYIDGGGDRYESSLTTSFVGIDAPGLSTEALQASAADDGLSIDERLSRLKMQRGNTSEMMIPPPPQSSR